MNQPNQQGTPARKESWQDGIEGASPKRSLYHTVLRTDAYVRDNLSDEYLEFWVAVQLDPKADKWRVMHYKLYDMMNEDGDFKPEIVASSVPFIEAVAHLSKSEYFATKQLLHKVVDIKTRYPEAQYPEMRVVYYDIPHYKEAAAVEGLAFDKSNAPYRRVQGMIFADGVFKRSEIAKSILAVENKDNLNARPVMEAGILSDIFSTSSARAATLDGILRVYESLSLMDEFADRIGGFYLSVQKMLGQKESFDAIEDVTGEERKHMIKEASRYVEGTYEDIERFLVEDAAKALDKAESKGVHVEPFRKFLAECEVYLHMLNASIRLPQLERSLMAASQADVSLAIRIQESVSKAEVKFKQLGGTDEQVDQLKAWVANPNKDSVPAWLPGFLTRYRASRKNVMAKVQARNAKIRDVQLMSADVKPPLAEDPKLQPAPAAEQDDKPASKADKPAAGGKKSAPGA